MRALRPPTLQVGLWGFFKMTAAEPGRTTCTGHQVQHRRGLLGGVQLPWRRLRLEAWRWGILPRPTLQGVCCSPLPSPFWGLQTLRAGASYFQGSGGEFGLGHRPRPPSLPGDSRETAWEVREQGVDHDSAALCLVTLGEFLPSELVSATEWSFNCFLICGDPVRGSARCFTNPGVGDKAGDLRVWVNGDGSFWQGAPA